MSFETWPSEGGCSSLRIVPSQELQQSGQRPNLVVFTAMLTAYGRAGRYADAEEMWREMRAAGCVPGLAAYTALMSAYARQGLAAVSISQFVFLLNVLSGAEGAAS